MALNIVDRASVASGADNEDRAGAAPPLAWVIDGATDVLPEPLTRNGTDAAWFAAAVDDALRAIAAEPPANLSALPQALAERIAPEFLRAAVRPPTGREEHPSASGVVVRATQGGLEYVSVGDCTLLVEQESRLVQVGVDESEAGDRWVADALSGRVTEDGAPAAQKPLTRADLWPRLFAQRARMNTENGYGVFSITPTPPRFVRHGRLALPAGARILLATDGLMRLVDVFRRYDAARLFAAAWSDGLAPLVAELRAIEAADAACSAFPRAKVSDDTTAMLLEIS